jgi:hypothetical protein
MRPKYTIWNWRHGAWLALGLATLANGGCLWLAVGAAAGGTAAGVAYARGKVHEMYAASFDDTWAATRTALTELGLPLLEEKRESVGHGYIRSKAGDDSKVQVYLETEPSQFPAEGPVTRVDIRVATFGNFDVSARVLTQISAHLTVVPSAQPPAAVLGQSNGAPPPGGNVVGAGWTGPTAPPPPANVGAPRTPEPPLATTEPPLAPQPAGQPKSP